MKVEKKHLVCQQRISECDLNVMRWLRDTGVAFAKINVEVTHLLRRDLSSRGANGWKCVSTGSACARDKSACCNREYGTYSIKQDAALLCESRAEGIRHRMLEELGSERPDERRIPKRQQHWKSKVSCFSEHYCFIRCNDRDDVDTKAISLTELL